LTDFLGPGHPANDFSDLIGGKERGTGVKPK
jgi:hypothetical protein